MTMRSICFYSYKFICLFLIINLTPGCNQHPNAGVKNISFHDLIIPGNQIASLTQSGVETDEHLPDDRFTQSIAWGDQGDGTYHNPIVWADYNNPFMMQHGDDYYMIAASHHFMGMPVLHSKDLVNWKLINRVYRQINSKPKYDIPGKAYKHGSWAPTMVYRDGYFRIYVFNSTDGLYMSQAKDPAGEWEPLQLIHEVERWEDPYVFWDEDGSTYLVHSGKSEAPVTIHRMNNAGTKILDAGKVIVHPNGHNPFIIKKSGYYYLFATGSGHNTQDVYRAKNIMGPYEHKVVLEKGGRGPSPGGGGYVEMPDGSAWFLHHVGISGHGRMPFLEPVHWRDGWPEMGIDKDGNGIGEPLNSYTKPVDSKEEMDTSFRDNFDMPEITNEWYWNHNPNHNMYETGDGQFTIYADTLYALKGIDGSFNPVSFDKDDIRRARNTLAFMPIGIFGEGVTKMNIKDMDNGQRAGLAFFNQEYFWLGVVNEAGQNHITWYTNDVQQKLELMDSTEIWLKAIVKNGTGQLSYSLDGKAFHRVPHKITFERQWFENHKVSLFSYNVKEPKGAVSFDWFQYNFVPGNVKK